MIGPVDRLALVCEINPVVLNWGPKSHLNKRKVLSGCHKYCFVNAGAACEWLGVSFGESH